jgi:hypothetical protein
LFGCSSSRQTLNQSPIAQDSPRKSENNYPYGKKYEYVYRLAKPVSKDKLFFSDGNISVEFVIDGSFIHLRLKNTKNERITVSLDDAQIFINARASKVVNFNYFDEFSYSPNFRSSTLDISPNAFVELHLAPSDNVVEDGGTYDVVSFYPVADFNDKGKEREIYSNVGKRIGLYLPVETEDEIYDYYFEFQIVDVKEVGPYYPKKKQVTLQSQIFPEIVVKSEGLSPSESFIASTLISFFVLISAYFIFAREKGKI